MLCCLFGSPQPKPSHMLTFKFPFERGIRSILRCGALPFLPQHPSFRGGSGVIATTMYLGNIEDLMSPSSIFIR